MVVSKSGEKFSVRRRVVAGIAAAGLVTQVAAVPAVAQASRFAGGRSVARSSIAGDSSSQRAAKDAKDASGTPSGGGAAGSSVARSSFGGDGRVVADHVVHSTSTGGLPLIAGSGLKFYVNGAITFQTSSSGAGAMSEASFTHSVNASTSGGGTVASTLNDMFDGFGTLGVVLGADTALENGPVATGNAHWKIYNDSDGDMLQSCDDQAINFDPTAYTNGTDSVEVSRQVMVSKSGSDSYARWLNTVKNTGSAPVTVDVYPGNNFGSDSNTRIFDSSSGDATGSTADDWIASFQNYSLTTSSDPRSAIVFQNAGGDVKANLVTYVDGDDNPFWRHRLTIPAGATQSVVWYADGEASKAAASAAAANIASVPPYKCMTIEQATSVKNFDMDHNAPTLSAATKTSFSAGEPLDLGITASDADTEIGDSADLSCSPAIGTPYKTSMTSVTCTATDQFGKTATSTTAIGGGAACPTGNSDGVTCTARPGGGFVLQGSRGRDHLVGTSHRDIIRGGGGNDVINGKGGSDTIRGGKGNDRIKGGKGNDRINGGSGNDHIWGGSGRDRLHGGAGDDVVHGGADTDHLFGDDGDDWLYGDSGDDWFWGGPGTDWMIGGPGIDTHFDGGSGPDFAGRKAVRG